MSEIDVISHLMNVENQASTLIFEAQGVAEKNITEARSKAETLYKERYEKLIKELEFKYTQNTEQVLQENRNNFLSYQQKIKSTNQDITSFNAFLESLLFEGKK